LTIKDDVLALLETGKIVDDAEFIDVVWGGYHSKQTINCLRVYICGLRKEHAIVRIGNGYLLKGEHSDLSGIRTDEIL